MLAYDVRVDPAISALGIPYLPLDELLPQCDIITLHTPLLPATFHLMNRARIMSMKVWDRVPPWGGPTGGADSRGRWDRRTNGVAVRGAGWRPAAAPCPVAHVPACRARLRCVPLQEGAMLINVSRGGLIESEALFDGLETGHIGALGIDVFGARPLAASSVP